MIGRGVILSVLAVVLGACGGSGKRPPLEEVPIDYGPSNDQPVATTTTSTASATASASAAPEAKPPKHPKKKGR